MNLNETIKKILNEEIHNNPVVSSNIINAEYDDETEVLTITFKNGGMYEYSGVPLNVYQEFLEAPSVGSFLHSSIKPFYEVQKIA